jgi:hypothetical protein
MDGFSTNYMMGYIRALGRAVVAFWICYLGIFTVLLGLMMLGWNGHLADG